MTQEPWILSCGEALFDVATSDAVTLHAAVGGGPTNTAMAIARAGLGSALWTGIPEGIYGERIVTALQEAGVSTSALHYNAAPPTMAFVTPRGTSVKYDFYAEGTATFDITIEDIPVAAPDGRRFAFVHLGALGTAVEPMASTLRAAAERWSALGTPIGYDPNMRSDFGTRGQSVPEVEDWFRRAQLIKVSTEDLEALYGSADPDTGAERVLSFGPRVVLVTDGPGPVRAYDARGGRVERRAAPWPAGVLPVGAGDAFISGVYGAIARGAEWRDPGEEGLSALLGAGIDSVSAHAERRRLLTAASAQ
jgi:fructokinase